jgi:hypothetical protein
MFKVIAASTVLVLLIGSGAMGSILTQDQGMSIGTINAISLLHGQQNAGSSQTVIVSITQDDGGIGSMFGSAHLVGINSQIGGISAMASLVHVGGLSMGSLLTSTSSLDALTGLARLNLLMLSAN